jgi:glycosyltransferase involved in cell wall biosynthesis
MRYAHLALWGGFARVIKNQRKDYCFVKILLVTSGLKEIGGIETHCVNWCKRMSPIYEIDLIYDYCHPTKMKALSQYANLIKFDKNKTYTADKVIYVSGWGETRTERNYKSTSGEYWQEVHADYEFYANGSPDYKYIYKPLSNITGHICVSETAKRKLIKKYGKLIDINNIKVLRNMVDLDAKGKKIIRFITATRMHPTKGSNRMIQMVDLIRKADLFLLEWDMFSDSNAEWEKKIKDYPEFILHGKQQELQHKIKNADYLVQLSASEGDCMSTREATQQGTPCIVTNYESASEQIEDGVNGYIFKMDLSDFDAKKILKIPKKFEYIEKTIERDWVEVMGTPKSKPKKVKPIEYVEIVCVVSYTDTELNRQMKVGEVFKVEAGRAKFLCEFKTKTGNNICKIKT